MHILESEVGMYCIYGTKSVNQQKFGVWNWFKSWSYNVQRKRNTTHNGEPNVFELYKLVGAYLDIAYRTA